MKVEFTVIPADQSEGAPKAQQIAQALIEHACALLRQVKGNLDGKLLPDMIANGGKVSAPLIGPEGSQETPYGTVTWKATLGDNT